MFKDFDEYQARAVLTAAVKQGGRVKKVWAGLEFASEILEVASLLVSNITKSQFRPKGRHAEEFKTKIKDELGDTLYNVATTADAFGIKMSELAEDNIMKVGYKHADLKGAGHGGEGGGKALQKPKGLGPIPPKPEDEKDKTCNINDKKRTTCKECGSKNLKVDGGCPTCVECGWSPCS